MTRTPALRRRTILAGAVSLVGCQASNAPQNDAVLHLGPNQTGYILLQAPIFDRTRDLFINDVNRLLALNAAEITVLINSPGGVISAAQDIINFMDRIHTERNVRFTTYNVGSVASAACYIFLAGQRRYSTPNGKFMFHEAAVVSNGPITSQRLQEESSKIQQIERDLIRTLVSKTRLTEAEAASFTRRTVILSADEARRDGLVEAVLPFAAPPDTVVAAIRWNPPTRSVATPRPVPPG